MAEKKTEGAEEKSPPKKRGKLLLFIIIGAVVLALVLGGGIYFFLKKKSKAAEDGDEPVATEKDKRAKKDHPDAPPVFVKLEPFTVKLQPDQNVDAYLQVIPELRVIDAPTGDKVKLYVPEIRHKVLMLLSGKKPSEISEPKGLQRLANEIRDAINVIIDGPPKRTKGKEKADAQGAPAEASDEPRPDDSVQAVLFTSFVIQ